MGTRPVIISIEDKLSLPVHVNFDRIPNLPYSDHPTKNDVRKGSRRAGCSNLQLSAAPIFPSSAAWRLIHGPRVPPTITIRGELSNFTPLVRW